MSIKEFFPNKYLKAEDIKPDEVVTIKEVRSELVGRDQDELPVMYLNEYDRSIVLNKTNANAVADVYGDDEVKWSGKKVKLFLENVRNVSTGKVGPAIRMMPTGKIPF